MISRTRIYKHKVGGWAYFIDSVSSENTMQFLYAVETTLRKLRLEKLLEFSLCGEERKNSDAISLYSTFLS